MARTHPLNESYFKEINTPDKAYVLGYFTADGCIENKYVVSFIAHVDDVASLEFVRTQLGAETYQIKKNKVGNCYRLSVAGRRLVLSLMALGLCSRKSSADCPYPILRDDLHAAFILGVFDGDGSIYSALHKRYKNKTWMMDFSGTPRLLQGIRRALAKNVGTNPQLLIRRRRGNCHRLFYAGNEQVERIGRYLYSSNPPSYCLQRKSLRFLEVNNRPLQAPHPSSLKTHCIRGHAFTPDNVYCDPKRGRGRACLTCRRDISRAYMRQLRSHSDHVTAS